MTAIEKTVACRTGRNAKSFEFFLTVNAKPFCPCAGCQNHRITGVKRAAIALSFEGAFRDVQIGDDIADDFRAHGLGVVLHTDHQVGALHFAVPGPVLHFGGCGQLPAGLDALNQYRIEHGSAGINPGRIAGRTGADDQDFRVARIGHGISYR